MLVSMLPPDNSHQLRSENVHLEADGPGFDSQHLHEQASVEALCVVHETERRGSYTLGPRDGLESPHDLTFRFDA